LAGLLLELKIALLGLDSGTVGSDGGFLYVREGQLDPTGTAVRVETARARRCKEVMM
jgi:hypothetical protein